jgi:tRNA(fMet)-specific endonuclease VapC
VAVFDQEATMSYGRIRAALERKGRPIGAMDLLIAAQAVSLNVKLITNNVAEFRQVPGLKVKHWV